MSDIIKIKTNKIDTILSLGAINKLTGEYVYPKIANKKDEYICCECNNDLILCQGKIKIHHFRHKVDHINPCNHYSNPTETQIHKDAKILLKTLLDKKISIEFIRNCVCCKKNEIFEIPIIDESSSINLEYRFEYNGLKIADVAYINNNDIVCIFEICNTHKTLNENRPEPWFEIDAKTLIKLVNDNDLSKIQIPCIRCEKCDKCIENIELLNNHDKLEEFIRRRLGQKIFPTPYWKDFEKCKECKDKKYPLCDNCKDKTEYYDNYQKNGHLRIHGHARDDLLIINRNKKIIELFEDLYKDKKCVIHTHKGRIKIYIISNKNYDKYDYYFLNTTLPDHNRPYENDNFPYFAILDYGYIGTVTLIKNIILRINNNDWSNNNECNIEFRNNIITQKIVKSSKNNKQLKLSDFGLVKCKSK